jgi:hypothetical protein
MTVSPSLATVRSRLRRVVIPVAVILVILIGSLALVALPATSAPPSAITGTHTTNETASLAVQNGSPSHTLVIKTTGDPVSYSITASEGISGKTDELIDSISGTTFTGQLGGTPYNKSNDTKDVIKYEGYIQTLEYRGNDIQIFLDGRRVPPDVLTGNYIKLSYPSDKNGTQPIQYRIATSDSVIPGELTEKTDRSQTSSDEMKGQLTQSDVDTFYFTGEVSEFSFTAPPQISVNNQSVPLGEPDHFASATPDPPPPTGTPTTNTPATNTPAPETSATNTPTVVSTPTVGDTPKTTTTDTTGSSVTTTTDRSDSSAASASQSPPESGGGFLLGIVSGGVVMGTVVIAVFLYFRPENRRW